MLALALCLGPMALVGCEQRTPAEEEAEEMGDRIEDATDDAGDAVEDMGDKIEDATE
jgi:hypothetical protein